MTLGFRFLSTTTKQEAHPIRLLAMDLDDTLLTKELVIPPSAKGAIAAAKKAGVRIVIATGRMFVSALPHAQFLEADGPIIAYNGGLVSALSGEVISHNPVPPSRTEELIALAEEHDLCLNLYVDDKLYVPFRDERVEYYESISQLPANVVPDLRQVAGKGSTKALIVDTPEMAEAWVQRLSDRYGESLNITRSKPRFVELTAPGVSKGVALATLVASLGISAAEVMAIGDSYNDLDMLEFAGIGVAIGNAAEEVKEQADYVTAPNTEDGIAKAVERFILT